MTNPRERLVRAVQHLERLEEKKQAAGEALSEGFQEARRQGFDPVTLRVVLKLRKLTPSQREERRALEAIYLAALGMLEGDSLPESARRRFERKFEPPSPGPKPSPPPPPAKRGGGQSIEAPKVEPMPEPEAPAPSPAQPLLPLKEPDEARKEGEAAAAAGARIYDNPYPAGDPCRAAWDEGWCAQQQSHGMDLPAAFKRRTPAPEPKPAEQKRKGA